MRTSNKPECGPKDIPALWERFAKEGIAETIPNRVGTSICGIYTDYETDHTGPYTFIVGCEVSSFREDCALKTSYSTCSVEPCTYALVPALGGCVQNYVQIRSGA